MERKNEIKEDNSIGKSKYENLLFQKEPEILEKWRKEQEELKKKLIIEDKFKWSIKKINNLPTEIENNLSKNEKEGINGNNIINIDNSNEEELKFIGGMDISASKIHQDMAISCLVVCNLKMEPVYEICKLVKMNEPYIPGFLAFREVNHLLDLINELKIKAPQYIPQVILVDGNGILHVKGFGLASHLGVLIDIPTIGCGKTVFNVDGISKKGVKDIAKKFLLKGGDSYPLIGTSGTLWGFALKSTDVCINPMIISAGHKISNETSLEIVKMSTIYRVPQPIRFSDKISRKLISAFERFINKNPNRQFDTQKYMKDHYDYLYSDLD